MFTEGMGFLTDGHVVWCFSLAPYLGAGTRGFSAAKVQARPASEFGV